MRVEIHSVETGCVYDTWDSIDLLNYEPGTVFSWNCVNLEIVETRQEMNSRDEVKRIMVLTKVADEQPWRDIL